MLGVRVSPGSRRLAATVLQIIPRLDTGGAELATLEIAQALVESGARALVASEGGRLGQAIREAGGELIAFPAGTKNPLRMWSNGRALARLIANEHIDLIHARSRAPAWSALYAARKTGIPFVTTYHGAYGIGVPLKNAYNSVMARGDRVIANSHFTADLIRERHGIGDERLRVIHRGVDLAAFDPAQVTAKRVKALRKEWGVGDGTRIVLHAARLTGWKGQRQVIEAAGLLAARGGLKDVVFILAGDAQGRETYANELTAMIQSHDLADAVRLVGHCGDMAGAFAAAHIAVVASSEPEAFGRAAAEAQAMGCPVVATDLGAARETVMARPHVADDAATGWLVEAGKAEALAPALEEALLLGKTQRGLMGARARRHIVENFSLARMRHRTLGIYDDLLGSGLAKALEGALGAKRSGGKSTGSP